MPTALIVGSAVGAVIGLVHGWGVYKARIAAASGQSGNSAAPRMRAAYHALWTLALWVLFGAYVFYLWLIGVVLYAGYRALGLIRRPQTGS